MRPFSLKWRLLIPISIALAAFAAIVIVLAYDSFSEFVVAQTHPLSDDLTTSELLEELHELLWGIMLTSVVVFAIIVVLSGFFIELALRPVHHIAEKLVDVTTGNMSTEDWPLQSVPPELAPFVHAVAEMMDRLNKGIQQQKTFIADAAHELRTPIAVAKSTLQVAQAADRSEAEYRQAVEEATDDLRRLEHLVEELLTLARLDEVGNQVALQELDLAHLLRDLASSFQQRASTESSRLICDLAPAHVHGNASQLKRLFSNLLDNAQRHGPARGNIHLILRTTVDMVEVAVEDQGGTIPADTLEHLFDRFYRIDSSRTEATGGAGLGLAIAQTIALRHKGQIEIHSTPGVGTCARVRLPLPH